METSDETKFEAMFSTKRKNKQIYDINGRAPLLFAYSVHIIRPSII